MKTRSHGISSVGKVRDHNEDAFLIKTDENIYVVADGMGGHAAGEVASDIAVRTVSGFIHNMDEDSTWPFDTDPGLSHEGNRLATAIRMGNRRVVQAVEKNAAYTGMGTTLVSLFLKSGIAYIGHVGDSRAYLVRGGDISRLTVDHSWVNTQIQAGTMTPETAKTHPLRNVITRALGSEEDVSVDIIEIPVEEEDTYILCSDGLSSMLEDREILRIMEEGGDDIALSCEKLVDAANEKGGEDNITVVIVKVDEKED